MNKNGLQVLENIYAAQRLILMTGVNIIRMFSKSLHMAQEHNNK